MRRGVRDALLLSAALGSQACGCKRPSVVEAPEATRVASISIRVTAAGQRPELKVGQALLFGAGARNTTPEDMARIAADLNLACGGQPCIAGVVPLRWSSPPGPGGAAGAGPEQPSELLVCAETRVGSGGRLNNAPGFEAFLGQVRANVEASGGQVQVQKHYVWEYAARPTSSADLDPEALAAATADTAWALKQIDWERAARLVRDHTGQEPGHGVVVAHMDTGYTRNCHTFADDPAGPVQPTLGYDFFGCLKDPKDPLTPAGLPEARQPGHGTGTGSVMVAPHAPPPGCASSDYSSVQGVAPAAEMVPIRVSDGILLGLPAIPKALFEEAGGIDIDHRVVALAAGIDQATRSPSMVGRLAQVVSISMGGVCAETDEERRVNAALQEAISHAERKGVIVVAAAGQYPIPSWLKGLFFGKRFPVTFPGSYPSAIAVAGSTIFGTPWKKSSRGPQVAVTAPAYGVWRAATAADASQSLGPGQGTSFATAITAGVAALWVQYNNPGGQDLWFKYGPATASAFRWVLAHGGARSPQALCQRLRGEPYGPRICEAVAAWDTKEFGAGLLDAAAVLETALPSREEVCQAEKTRRTPEDYAAVCPPTWPPSLL